eukprot:gnl/TRDRNA2_/TRDRNA2_80219_c0_seq1.p1 gnl/TRDRNA2_/TRDRNA2_80219_c0~~gnl/TRDRNA2_/TRDRNA2_80219_c0_seq1.p1  ORF type:complete len:423 (-),score=34.77 gnl/TRDRNA2_/TRDRNA2_80219_c0_seq1:110-1378(-)
MNVLMSHSCFVTIALLMSFTGPCINVDALRLSGMRIGPVPDGDSDEDLRKSSALTKPTITSRPKIVSTTSPPTIVRPNVSHNVSHGSSNITTTNPIFSKTPHRATTKPPVSKPPPRVPVASPSSIPLRILVTAPYAVGSVEYKRICGNLLQSKEMNASQAEGTSQTKTIVEEMWTRCAASRFAQFVPEGSHFEYFSDAKMKESTQKISLWLQKKGIAKDAYAAFTNLRPAAFRADVWRLMELWAGGGVYLDMNVKLKQPLSYWIDFARDKLVLVKDAERSGGGYWNAMMASEPKNPFIEKAIATVIANIKDKYYGAGPLTVTGPLALKRAFQNMTEKDRRLEYELDAAAPVKVLDIRTKKEVIATKDEWLHRKYDGSTDYQVMWDHHTVYCDEGVDIRVMPKWFFPDRVKKLWPGDPQGMCE